jgi:large subunit ribosomal protein L5
MGNMKDTYTKNIVPELKKSLNCKNMMEVPKLEKVILNMGLGEAVQNIKILDSAVVEMGAIAGQQPVITRAKKSIAGFKLREGMPIGCKVTLRGDSMYSFVDKLINVAIPRIRDFRGVSSKGFDGRGNYTLGIKEHIIFPDIDIDKIDKVKGLNITFVTTGKNDDAGRSLLTLMGMPFKK